MEAKQREPWMVWREAAKRDAIDAAIRELYDDLNAAVAARSPVCNASGRCCKFETYGHRLYVTGLEIAWFLLGVGSQVSGGRGKTSATNERAIRLQQLAPATSHQSLATNYDGCLYQVDGLCSTHPIRPLGCRTYFCEEGTEDWQQDTTELFLGRLKHLHLEHDLPYSYMEWRAGLAEAMSVLEGSI